MLPETISNGRVTVVIPTYNRAALVVSAIRSALRQTARDRCDIVIVDDGSSDHTPEVVRQFAGEILYLRQPNAGVSVARNSGIRARPNEFVAFLDSDDEWAPEKTERQLAALRRHPPAVFVAAHGGRRTADGEQWSFALPAVACGRPIDLAPHLFEQLFLLTSAVMVRTKHLLTAGPFCPSLTHGEDHLLWLRLACRGPGIVLDEHLVTCGWNAPLSLASDAERVSRARIRIRYMMRRELRRRPDCRPAWRRGLARVLADLRDRALRQGRYPLAARYALRTLMVSPRGRPRWEWGRFAHLLLRSVAA